MSLFSRLRRAWDVLKKKQSSRYFAMLAPNWISGRPAAWSDDPREQVNHYKHWVFSAVQASDSMQPGQGFWVAITDAGTIYP